MNKKITPYLFGVSAAGLTILLAGTASYIVMPPGGNGIPELQVAPQDAYEMAAAVLDAKCAACHGENATYNSFANFFSFGLIRADVEAAQRAFTISPVPDLRSDNVAYLKMHRVLDTRRMPPARYSAVHLGARMTPEDVAVLRTRYTRNGAVMRMFRPIAEGTHQEFTPIYNAMFDGAQAMNLDLNKVLLGHKLFFDPRLSTTDSVSCATCHDLTKGGTDNKPKSEGVPGPDGKPQLGGVNAPTVYNAAGNIRQFWDGRAANLQEQAGGPPLNPVEMGYSHPDDWGKIAGKLSQDPELVSLFQAVYGDKGITGETITDAIAAFEMCLSTPGSAFDAFLMGEDAALTPNQLQGMDAYIRYGCATCHSGPTLGGISFEFVNTFSPLRAHADGYEEGAFGRKDFTKDAKHHDMFRVPNLRNVALTAPYFHTGTVAALEDAVRIMFHTQVGSEPSDATVKNVTAFLQAQTGKLGGKPLDQLTPADVAPIPGLLVAEPAAKTPAAPAKDAAGHSGKGTGKHAKATNRGKGPLRHGRPGQGSRPAPATKPAPAPALEPESIEPVPAPAVVEPAPQPAPVPAVVEPAPQPAPAPAVVEPAPQPAPAPQPQPEGEAESDVADLPRDIQSGDGVIIRSHSH